jgi:hypothetical protein
MNIFKRLFGSETKKSSSENGNLNPDEKELIKKFSKLSNANRMGKIMEYGDSKDLKYYPLLKYSIIYDPDIHVKSAALKRIHFFQMHPDVIPMLNQLNSYIDTRSLEPYYSIALSRLGVISREELENRINKR